MKMKETILKLLRQINRKIPDDTGENLLKGGILDSFDLINIVPALEKEFDTTIKTEDITPENFKSVDAMGRLILSYGGGKK